MSKRYFDTFTQVDGHTGRAIVHGRWGTPHERNVGVFGTDQHMTIATRGADALAWVQSMVTTFAQVSA